MTRRRSRRRFGEGSARSRWPLVLVAAGVLLLAGGAASEAAAAPGSGRRAQVLNRWAAEGVHPGMQALLDAWENEGWFDVEVGTPFAGFPGGGLRLPSDAAGQAKACQEGLSNACTLADTPHGRGAALDIWPVGFVPTKTYAQQPGMLEKMQEFGRWAASKGWVWGGNWSNPDYPHVELKNWRALPYPPPDYSAQYSAWGRA